jgi:endoglucanase
MPWYGFNFQWMCSAIRGEAPQDPDGKALDFVAETGFNCVRLPTDYRFWIRDFEYLHPDEKVLVHIDRALEACRARGLHLILNSHRTPGYCINANQLERDNLWTDAVAQEGFLFLWEMFARRYRGIPPEQLSFDLVNEPPAIGQFGFNRENHAALIRRAAAAIRAVDPARPIIIDGLDGGNLAMPELADLGVIHSGRGYQPMPVSHHQATWWAGVRDAPPPVYPGLVWDGRRWDLDGLREYYRPWREVEARGVKIHIGEFGCHNKTPDDIAQRWLADLLAVFREYGWGWTLWNFEGSFGIIGHNRPGAKFESFKGYRVDRALFDLLVESRISAGG